MLCVCVYIENKVGNLDVIYIYELFGRRYLLIYYWLYYMY